MVKPKLRILTEKGVREAERYLRKSDAVMARLVSDYGACPLAKREYRPFHVLTSAIISQQLSAKAADTIKRRVSQIVSSPFRPDGYLAARTSALRNAGLSQAKARYIRELAERVSDGRLCFDNLKSENDEAVISALIELPGIGRWTAEMFLIFGLKRPDVLSLNDAGLQRAAKMLYCVTKDGNISLERVGQNWAPHRSVASWYLWKHLDTVR